ncbi:GNAT family N-acetyltransferase [Roseibium sp. RKSG952]|uniref:GNAT family N-acetyltransferase n=1 Tax=Roseibium sp. RKSG952 TaxID=2529384 RepID=UPI0012BCED3E|nr:GNAT family N-acetyltransferase [Roseibium sp. RKSG952]MTH96043.1 N-acetyltransferase [Roseibium sp. RKSG952]
MIVPRSASRADCSLICRHREEMFRSAGESEVDLAAMAEPYRTWQDAQLECGTYSGFVAEADGQPVGSVGLMEIDWPPHPLHPEISKRGYVLNLYVEPEWRGRGIARQLMTCAEDVFRARGLTYAVLNATGQGRPLYEQAGWTGTAQMGKALTLE